MNNSDTLQIASPVPFEFMNYVRIARPDHWIKNIFMLPGVAVALSLVERRPTNVCWLLALAIASLCLLASANYTINEYLDGQYDRHHPLKRNRPAALGLLDRRLVLLQYLALAATGCALAMLVNIPFLLIGTLLLAMGVLYNVPPIRTKDRAYMDVLSESINNPLRFLLGWFVVCDALAPPSSVLIAYWMGGAFLMGIKRYSEYRRIGDAVVAAHYRRSFAHYDEQSLLLSAFFYALCSAFFMAVFLIKYRVELVLSFPLFSALFTWYLRIGLKMESAAQAPETLYREVRFLGFAAFVFLAVILLSLIHLPFPQSITEPYLIHLG